MFAVARHTPCTRGCSEGLEGDSGGVVFHVWLCKRSQASDSSSTVIERDDSLFLFF